MAKEIIQPPHSHVDYISTDKAHDGEDSHKTKINAKWQQKEAQPAEIDNIDNKVACKEGSPHQEAQVKELAKRKLKIQSQNKGLEKMADSELLARLDLGQHKAGQEEPIDNTLLKKNDSNFSINFGIAGIKKVMSPADSLLLLAKKALSEKGVKIADITKEQFKQEITECIADINNRGITTDQKMEALEKRSNHDGSKANQYKSFSNQKQLSILAKNYKQAKALDKIMERYINSGKCTKTKTKIKLYRAGHADYEGKILRNIAKSKEKYRKELINRGNESYGNGLYTGAKKRDVKVYSDLSRPSLSVITIKKGTPIVDQEDSTLIKELAQQLREETGSQDVVYSENTVKTYMKYMNPLPIVTKIKSQGYFIIKDPKVIDSIQLLDGSQKGDESEISFYKLGLDGQISGHPTHFKEIDLSDKVLTPTEHTVAGYKAIDLSGEPVKLPVFTYTVSDKKGNTTTKFATPHPENHESLWVVKKQPLGGGKYNMLLEPDDTFLSQRYQEKQVDKLTNEIDKIEAKANEKIDILWQKFSDQIKTQ